MSRRALCALIALAATLCAQSAWAQETTLKGLGRFEGWRENALIGYGLVVGLAGSGDSPRSGVTRQALRNVYSRFGASVGEEDIASRNVAVVMVIASLPASANIGDRLSATVSSAADARSLAGGTLLMTQMHAPDGRVYALAQGALVAGGDSFESQLNVRQRNYPTTARLDGGVTVETAVGAEVLNERGELGFLLNEPDFSTASRIANAINNQFGAIATAASADEVRIRYGASREDLTAFLATVENLMVAPDRTPRVVINERTGTVVAGGDVTISSVVIAQGDIRVTITAETTGLQPSFVEGPLSGVRSLLITNTSLDVERGENDVVARFPNTSVADLVQGLSAARVDTRRMISILQAIKAAGALHAEIVVQ